MLKQESLEKLKQANVDLDEKEAAIQVIEVLNSGAAPMEIIINGMKLGLSVIGDEFQAGTGFMSHLMIAGQIMNDATDY